MIVTT